MLKSKKIKILEIYSYFINNIRFKIPFTLIEQMNEN